MHKVRVFLIAEVIAFTTACLIHLGWLMDGYAHQRASIAEGVIAFVLLIGLILSFITPALTFKTGLAVQAFALLGTLVGILTIVLGIGPQTLPDILYHVAIAAILFWGIVIAKNKDQPI